MTKSKSSFICQNCGYAVSKWMGKCPDCGEWNSIAEEPVQQFAVGRPGAGFSGGSAATAFHEVSSQDHARFSSGLPEFDRVLGGGIVPGSLVLLGGDPGIGKSTLMAQVAESLCESYGKVLYVSGEESARQIKLRGERLGLSGRGLFLLAETSLERIFDEVSKLEPGTIIID